MADLNLATSGSYGLEPKVAALPLVVAGDPLDSEKMDSALTRICGVLNGKVERANFSSSALNEGIPWRAVRRRAGCDAWTVGGTANLDLLAFQFNTEQSSWASKDDAHEAERWIPLPGASKTVHLTGPAVVVVTWQVSGLADGVDGSIAGWLLKINGVAQDATLRWHRGAGQWFTGASGYAKQRIYSGHMVCRLEQGVNHISLEATGTSMYMKLFRNWVRSLQVVALYIGESTGYDDVAGPDV